MFYRYLHKPCRRLTSGTISFRSQRQEKNNQFRNRFKFWLHIVARTQLCHVRVVNNTIMVENAFVLARKIKVCNEYNGHTVPE